MPEVAGTIPQLTRWGVSADADLIYRALTMLGTRTDTQLAHELGLARKRVRSALDELSTLSAAAPAVDGWRHRPVSQVLAGLHRPRARPISEQELWRRHFAALHGIELPDLHSPLSRWWRSRASTRQRVRRLVAAERYEHMTINTEVITAAASAAALPLDRSQIARRVRVRVLNRPVTGDDHTPHHLADLNVPDERQREIELPPIKLLVYDRQVALFPVDPLNFEAGYLETAHPVAVQQLCALFDRLWAQAPRPGRGGRPAITLTPREQALVALLAAGHTDATAARELQLSLRTVAYTMRNLMDRLGVENRFQLAILLGACGAVTPLPSTRTTDVPIPEEKSE
ncbi:LuxR C-terminal-related transcriptional regulator [Solwaraspora sp. WMMB335]|uniref:helix-turn-helix transcriptional regulator n=1 Tax=Solwaraspora sp. WMMB335 TaxID=3404118 RepID=UPI003B928830